jgi:hypothetical protein
LILGYSDVYAAAEDVPELLSFGPLGLEGVDDQLVGQNRLKGLNTEAITRLPEGRGWASSQLRPGKPNNPRCQPIGARVVSRESYLVAGMRPRDERRALTARF